MLQQITWSDYWKIIIVLTILYESAVVLLFYRKEVLLLAKGKKLVLPVKRKTDLQHEEMVNEEESVIDEAQEFDEAEDDENLLPDASELAESIKVLITQAGDKGYAKEELLFALQQLTKDYPQLKNTRHQRDINTVINLECKSKCAFHLRTGELDKVWLS